MQKKIIIIGLILLSFLITACNSNKKEDTKQPQSKIEKLLMNYADVKLDADLSVLSENQKKMIPLLIDAAKLIDEIYWAQTCGNKDKILNSITDEKVKKYFMINYGPWDRLAGLEPFVKGIPERPNGANFYPKDMTYQEFDEFEDLKKYSLYTLVRRNELGGLQTVPYHEAYKEKLLQIADVLNKAAELAEDKGFKSISS